MFQQARLAEGHGFIGVDGVTSYDDDRPGRYLDQYISRTVPISDIAPDVSERVIIRDLAETRQRLATVGGTKYTYAQLDLYTDFIGRALMGVAQTSRVDRKGVLPQAVYLTYSQEGLASYGMRPADLGQALNARNITLPAGSIEAGARKIQVDPSGRFEDAVSIGNVIVGASTNGSPLYLRDR